jgi:hypothetical protein
MSNLQNAARIRQDIASYIVAAATTSTTSASPFGQGTYYIRVQVASGGSANVRIGKAPLVASTTDTLLNSNYPEYFLVNPGESIAAIATSATTINVSECGT